MTQSANINKGYNVGYSILLHLIFLIFLYHLQNSNITDSKKNYNLIKVKIKYNDSSFINTNLTNNIQNDPAPQFNTIEDSKQNTTIKNIPPELTKDKSKPLDDTKTNVSTANIEKNNYNSKDIKTNIENKNDNLVSTSVNLQNKDSNTQEINKINTENLQNKDLINPKEEIQNNEKKVDNIPNLDQKKDENIIQNEEIIKSNNVNMFKNNSDLNENKIAEDAELLNNFGKNKEEPLLLDIDAIVKTANDYNALQGSDDNVEKYKSKNLSPYQQEFNLIEYQIERCWQKYTIGKKITQTKVTLVVKYNKRGYISEIIDNTNLENKTNSDYEAIKQDAISALKDCNPLKNISNLNYRSWDELRLNFSYK